MIKFSNVNKWYGSYQALVDINAEVKRGEVVVVWAFAQASRP